MKESDRINRKRKILNVIQWIVIVFAIASMLGFIVSLVLLGIGKDLSLTGILSGSFLAASILFGALSFLLFRALDRSAKEELDALEREDGENSFFVGEGMLATLDDREMVLHGNGKRILIPYSCVRFFSLCSRKAPAERGEWSVLIELPAKYLDPKADGKEKPVLIQTDAKERLYKRLEELSLPILGEKREEKEDYKFVRLEKFTLPEKTQKFRATAIIIIGAVLGLLGLLVLLFQEKLFPRAGAMGSIAFVLGVYFTIRGLVAFFKAKTRFELYAEGIFYSDSKGSDRVFLKWEEIEDVEKLVRSDGSALRVKCLYGNYDFPLLEGAYEAIKERRARMGEPAEDGR